MLSVYLSYVKCTHICSLTGVVLSFMSFFFNLTAPTEIYTLSLHDALPIFFLRPEAHRNIRQRLRIWNEPGLRPVGEVAVGEDHDRHHVLDGDAHRLVGDVEAVAGRARRDDHDGALAVAAVEGLHQGGLLG